MTSHDETEISIPDISWARGQAQEIWENYAESAVDENYVFDLTGSENEGYSFTISDGNRSLRITVKEVTQ
jgi:hypothetical protein